MINDWQFFTRKIYKFGWVSRGSELAEGTLFTSNHYIYLCVCVFLNKIIKREYSEKPKGLVKRETQQSTKKIIMWEAYILIVYASYSLSIVMRVAL